MTIKAALALQKITKKKLTLGNMLWSIRMCDEKNQAVFAKKLDISSQYLCDIENGRRTVSPVAAKKFAEKLGYLPEQFVELSIQDMLDHEKIKMKIHIEKAA
ncbi:MAG: hypothetical protein A3I77_05360 [Gammaproteobacteria bacterium RIFCSPLOWO2_02_FULL_42_14]|nr:MAG: hypothetical protein A3B71_01925 [Gammaproteobacteria bacterium RIFCSPHIGHO2_02_FULL_42_43]OGT28364.1 MAG: hypothetical protein A2624_02835 [Gammaproteobacteria bacterium RIFCSPHIGHO2_01_FULL_42_8]OGT51200.1 MAG: hypothetical protein A3E54_03115 [Gammaproteobacteria bacterium RIFCSPHIGHO2_12_FULL_41_25]OGT62962.1 MAG: hypothetical protein A3I77_05360 [Gammaproteobacteria bacterium RIFCSPLOWO2_02_FULL_42_14]OGT86094.1 MAG: hypothetical protein A3G86_02915 [Gammaproteobacteria bacterium R